jgi:hypothetical protein
MLNSWDYEFMGDEFFQLASPEVREHCINNIYAVTDLCRLIWIKNKLESSYERAIWMDADVNVFKPALFSAESEHGYSFAHELLFLANNSIKHSLNNAVMIFDNTKTGLEVLDTYTKLSLDTLFEYNAGEVPRTAIGPMLLHKMPYKDVNKGVGLFTLHMMIDFANNNFQKLTVYENLVGTKVCLANLCHFMRNAMHESQQAIFDEVYMQAINNLQMVA